MYLAPTEFLASPEAMERSWPLEESLGYTRWLATHHYENFHVVSFLLPKRLHQDFYNVYSFCRWADDLGDEIGDPAGKPAACSQWWRGELQAMFAGRASHPVFVALQGTAARFDLPQILFDDLITAFEQDQTVTRYRNFEELFEYCRYSANPVGRLVLGSVRLPGRGTAGSFRCDLHGATARQSLAGRDRGSAERPRVSSAGRDGAPRLSRSRRCSPGALTLRFRDAMKDAVEVARESVPQGTAFGRDGGPPPGHRPGSVQPRRPQGARKDRAAGLQRSRRAARHLENGARRPAAGSAQPAGVFPPACARAA